MRYVRIERGQPDGETVTAEELAARLVAEGTAPEQVREVLHGMLQDAAGDLVAQWRGSAGGMLEQLYRVREGLESRIVEVWGPALAIYEQAYWCCLEAGDRFCTRTAQQARAEQDAKFEALRLQHLRACRVASEIGALLRTGHAEGALARWRTLHEIAVVALVLGEGDQELARRFLDHRAIERRKDARARKEHHAALGDAPLSPESLARIDAAAQQAAARHGAGFGDDWGWARPILGPGKPTFAALAEHAGLGHMRSWVKLASHSVHAGSTGALHGRDFHGYGIANLAGPANVGLAEPGHSALISLMQATAALLVCGSSTPDSAHDIVVLIAVRRLVEDAGLEFLAADARLEQMQTETEAGVPAAEAGPQPRP